MAQVSVIVRDLGLVRMGELLETFSCSSGSKVLNCYKNPVVMIGGEGRGV